MVALWLLAAFLCAELLLRARHRALDLARPSELRPETLELRSKQSHDALTIVCLGDSNTFGEGLPYEQSWPALLEAMLRAEHPELQVVVVNAGIRGDTAVMGWERLASDVLRYLPRFVISAFGANDGHLGLWPLDRHREQRMARSTTLPGQFEEWLMHSHVLLSLRARLLRLYRSEPTDSEIPISRNDQPRVSVQGFALAQRLIAARVRSTGSSVLLMTSTVPNPAWEQPGDSGQRQAAVYEQYNDVVRALAAELSAPLIDVQAELGHPTGTTRIAPDAVHLTAQGHRLVAELTLGTIQRSGLLPDHLEAKQ